MCVYKCSTRGWEEGLRLLEGGEGRFWGARKLVVVGGMFSCWRIYYGGLGDVGYVRAGYARVYEGLSDVQECLGIYTIFLYVQKLLF